jgi:hypothetical protein
VRAHTHTGHERGGSSRVSSHKHTLADDLALVTLTTDEAHETFEAIDKNRDEELSQIDYIQAFQRNPKIAKHLGLPNEIRQEDESRRLFQTAHGAIDTDNSKTISWHEFAAFHCTESQARSKPCKDKVSTSTPSVPASAASKIKLAQTHTLEKEQLKEKNKLQQRKIHEFQFDRLANLQHNSMQQEKIKEQQDKIKELKLDILAHSQLNRVQQSKIEDLELDTLANSQLFEVQRLMLEKSVRVYVPTCDINCCFCKNK